MKLLGIDYGEKRIGLATSTTEFGVSTPLCVLVNNIDTLNQIKKIATENRVGKIVIGLPLLKDGSESDICKKVRDFAKKVEEAINIPVVLQNEHLTSWEAEQYIKETMRIKEPSKIKDMIDKVSASMILNTYMGTKPL